MGDHYVPKYYLKGFCPNFGTSIWVFDKVEKKNYQTQVKSVANETKLYTEYLETHLTEEVENPANSILAKIWRKELLAKSEKIVFSHYIYKLIKRVPKGRERIQALIPSVALKLNSDIHQEIDSLVKENPSYLEIASQRKKEVDSILQKRVGGIETNKIWNQSVIQDSIEFVDLLSSMKWIFLVQQNNTFLTSDNPIFYFEGMGIANEKSELSFPITSNIMLWATWASEATEGYKTSIPSITKEFNRRTAFNYSRFIFAQNNEDWILPFISKNNFRLSRIV